MTEIEKTILEALRQLNQEMARVFSYDIAAEISDRFDKSARTVRYHLSKLYSAGLVQCPRGKRGGWVAA